MNLSIKSKSAAILNLKSKFPNKVYNSFLTKNPGCGGCHPFLNESLT